MDGAPKTTEWFAGLQYSLHSQPHILLYPATLLVCIDHYPRLSAIGGVEGLHLVPNPPEDLADTCLHLLLFIPLFAVPTAQPGGLGGDIEEEREIWGWERDVRRSTPVVWKAFRSGECNPGERVPIADDVRSGR
jgi:hypothetical protein